MIDEGPDMKATLRQSGDMMFTFQVKYAIGREDLERVVIGEDEPTADEILSKENVATRKNILDRMREQLRYYGPYGCGDWDDVTEDQMRAAEKVVSKVFPELYEGKTRRTTERKKR